MASGTAVGGPAGGRRASAPPGFVNISDVDDGYSSAEIFDLAGESAVNHMNAYQLRHYDLWRSGLHLPPLPDPLPSEALGPGAREHKRKSGYAEALRTLYKGVAFTPENAKAFLNLHPYLVHLVKAVDRVHRKERHIRAIDPLADPMLGLRNRRASTASATGNGFSHAAAWTVGAGAAVLARVSAYQPMDLLQPGSLLLEADLARYGSAPLEQEGPARPECADENSERFPSQAGSPKRVSSEGLAASPPPMPPPRAPSRNRPEMEMAPERESPPRKSPGRSPPSASARPRRRRSTADELALVEAGIVSGNKRLRTGLRDKHRKASHQSADAQMLAEAEFITERAGRLRRRTSSF